MKSFSQQKVGFEKQTLLSSPGWYENCDVLTFSSGRLGYSEEGKGVESKGEAK